MDYFNTDGHDKSLVYDLFRRRIMNDKRINERNWKSLNLQTRILNEFRREYGHIYHFTGLRLYVIYHEYFSEKYEPKINTKNIFTPINSDYSDNECDEDSEYSEEEANERKRLRYETYIPDVHTVIMKYKEACKDDWFEKIVDWFWFTIVKAKYMEEFNDKATLDVIDEHYGTFMHTFCEERLECLNDALFEFLLEYVNTYKTDDVKMGALEKMLRDMQAHLILYPRYVYQLMKLMDIPTEPMVQITIIRNGEE